MAHFVLNYSQSLLRGRISSKFRRLPRAFRHTCETDKCYSNQKDNSCHERSTDLYSDDKKLRLNDGNFIPRFGLGVWKIDEGPATVNAVSWALKVGYRQIDTASRYGNEEGVGKAVRESGIAREEIFVITKLYDDHHGYSETMKAFNESLSRLGLDYIDLYLIHSPMNGKILSTWEAMIELQGKKLVRSIGVSNFGIHHLVELQKASNVQPSVNQIEVHPYLQEKDLVGYCRENNIVVQAYSPLVNGRKFDDEVLVKLAKKYQQSRAVVLLRWCLEKGYVCIPKSRNTSRIEENMTVFDFELEPEDVKILDNLDQNFRTCHDKIKLPWTG